MNQTPETGASRPRWIVRHKGLAIIGGGFLLLAIIALAGVVYVRSGRLNRFIAEQVKAAVKDYGLRAEIGGFEISWGARTAKLRDIKIYNDRTGQLIAAADRAELVTSIPAPYALRLRREVVFKRLDVQNLNLWLDVDEQGRSNLLGLHPAPPTTPGRITFDFTGLVGVLDGGSFHVNDRLRRIVGEVGGLRANAQSGPNAMVNVNFAAGAGRFNYQGREITLDSLEVAGRGGANGAEIDRLALRSPAAEADISGRLDDWNAPRYSFGVRARLALGEIAKAVDQLAGLQGAVAFNGRVEGEALRYRVSGELTAHEVADADTRVRGAKVEGINVSSDGEAINFESSRARVQAISVAGAGLTGVTTGAIRGEFRDGRTQAATPQLSVERADLAQGQVAGITLQNVRAETSDAGRYQASGALSVNSGSFNGATFGTVTGQLLADNETVSLNKFQASLFGGGASGDVVVQLGRGGVSQLNANFNGLQTSDVLAVAAVKDAPLAGTVDGGVNINWPGVNVMAMSGAINARLSVATTQTADAVPVTGEVNVQARAGTFEIARLNLATDASRLSATGRLSPEGDSDLRFSLSSTRAEELQTIAVAHEEVRKAIADFEPQISGAAKIEGRITGKLTDPAIEADLNLAGISLFDEPLGALSGRLLFSPTELSFENGLLIAANGGTAKFNYAAPRSAIATEGKLDAAFDRISVETLIAAAGLPNSRQFITGELSGEARLTGLPGLPRGTATVNLVNGTLGGQVAESATANLVFDGRSARLERAEIRTAQGRLIAQGNLNLKSNDFQLQGNVENLGLGELAAAFDVVNPRVSGAVNATLNVTGNAKEVEQLKVELNAQGQNVALNGRPTGELTLTARTSAGGRIDLDLTTGIAGKPQPLRASIELRRPGRPIEIQADLTEFDLGPLIAAFAPNLSAVAATVNGRLRVAGPIVNAAGETTIEGLRGNLTLNTVSLQLSGRPIAVQTPLVVSLNGPQLTLERTRLSAEGTDLNLGGTLGLNEEARLNFAANGTANLETLSGLSQNLFFTGTVTLDARVEGAAGEPRLAGDIRINGFSFSMLDPAINIENGQGRFVLAGDRITLESFTARVNDGALTANGSLTLEQLQPKEWRFGLTANEVLVFHQGVQATLNADLALAGTPDGQSLTGTVTVPQAEYAADFNFENLAGVGGSSGGLSFSGGGLSFGGGGGLARLAPVSLDVRIEANDSLLIRNEQVNTVGSASLTVSGSLNDPSITGRVILEGGTIKFRSQRYEITAGTLDFPPGGGTDPEVNVQTEGDVGGYRVYVGLTGPLSELDVTLRSEPDLPRSDVLSLVTTGRTESDTLGSQDLLRSGVGTAASLLSQEFISRPTESLLGLNRFQIDPLLRPNSNPAARLTIGRQIARNLSFTYSTNLASEQDQTALAEYTLTNRFSGIASYTQGGNSARGGNTDSDFTIEVRGRKRFSLGYVPNDPAAGAGRASARSVFNRPPLPNAEVTINRPQDVKLNDKRMRELLPVAAQGFSRPLARLGERNLTNYLQERGYFFATVRSRCEPADCSGPDLRVLYDVQPGQRLDLEAFRLTGTDQINLGDVREEFRSQTAGFAGGIPFLKNLPLIGGYARGITSNDRLANDREVIRRRLVDLGFRSARVDTRLAFRPESDDLTVIFAVEEGPRSIVSGVALSGNLIIPYSELRGVVPIKDNDPFSLTAARDGAQSIRRHYADRGYLDARAELSVEELPENRLRLVYAVEEGSRNIADEIVVTGQTKTREASIRRFLAFDAGDTLTPALIRQTQRDLYATGAFREVGIRTEALPGGDPNARRVTVNLTEARPLLFVYGLGYSTDDGVRLSTQLTNNNLFGRANTASIRLRGSRREQLAQFQYTDLRPFNTKWATTVSTFFNRNTNLQNFARRKLVGGGFEDVGGRSFGINRFAAFLQTERKLSESTAIRFRYNFENARLANAQNIPIEEIARNQQSIRLGILAAGFTRDTRDSAINAARGQLFSAEHSVAARFLGGNEAFNKLFFNYQHYRTLSPATPLLGDSVLAAAARIGLAGRFGANSPGATPQTADLLPISERFFAGGATTLRGFRFEAAGPQGILEPRNAEELPTLVPIGGNALAVFNFELRYPLTRRLRLVPFYDLGNVFRRVNDFSFGGMTNTVGLGLRFNTPIGPVGVDYGYLLDPPAFTTASGGLLRPQRGVIHVRFGQTF